MDHVLLPYVNLDVLRRYRPDLDAALREREAAIRGRAERLASLDPDLPPSCHGVWIEHEDVHGAKPGDHLGQCSRRHDCAYPGKAALHSWIESCRSALPPCPRCELLSYAWDGEKP